MRLYAAVPVLALLLISCGGDGGTSYVPAEGYVRVENISVNLDDAAASLRNTPSPVHFADVPMPATLRMQAVGGDEESRASITVELPCGPQGDFFAGSEVIPASVVLETQGMTVFPPAEAYPSFRASVSANPLLEDTLEYSLEILFKKGGLEYQCSSSGEVTITTGTDYDAGSLPTYPPWAPGDTLFFAALGRSYDVKAGAVWIDSTFDPAVARLMLFSDSVPPADLTKPEGTRLETCIPLTMLAQGPVPAAFTCHLQDMDTTFHADTRFGWIEAMQVEGRLVGRLSFIGNGSAAQTRFRGDGPFDLKIR